MIRLYPWQKECINSWFENNSHGIVNVVTGAGKTIMALAAMKRLDERPGPPLRVKIIVPKMFMVSQWAAAMLSDFEVFGISRREIGYYYGMRKDPDHRKYMIYVINSARYSLSRHILSDIGCGCRVLLIADECHHYASEENQKIFEFLSLIAGRRDRYFSLGLSATPQTAGYESVLIPALGKEIYKYGFSQAMMGKAITPFVIMNLSLSFTAEEKAAYDDLSDRITACLNRLSGIRPWLKELDKSRFFSSLQMLAKDPKQPLEGQLARTALLLSYKRKNLIHQARSRFGCVYNLVRNLDERSRIIVFGERIEQADIVYEELNRQYPYQVGRYHSQMGETSRKNALGRYRDGEIRILVCCRALDEGFDVPATHVGIVLSSSSEERQRIQRLGRILRHSDGKGNACLYYFYIGNSSDESALLSEEVEGSRTLCLSYDQSCDSFLYPEYEDLAYRALLWTVEQGADESALREALVCLIKGRIRPDWILDEQQYLQKIRESASIREKNYWICMRAMAREREKNLESV